MRRVLSMAVVVLLAAGVALGETLLTEELAPARPVDSPGFFVTNDAAHPVPTVEGRIPFQRASVFSDFGTGRFRSFSFDVPEGKMAIIESFSMSAVVESGQKVRATLFFTGNARQTSEFGIGLHTVTLERVDGFGPKDEYTTLRSITGYCAGVEAVSASVERDSATGPGGNVVFSVSGYLVDNPSDPVP
jgi:hypothetical protein